MSDKTVKKLEDNSEKSMKEKLSEQYTAAKRKTKRFLLYSLGVIILIATFVFLFYYYGSYSEGYRAGTVMKLSKRGFFFKTYEGQLNVGGITMSNVGNSSVWAFSVESDRNDVIEILNEVAISHQRVKLFYEEKFVIFSWRGETKYLITKVERDSNPTSTSSEGTDL